MCLQEKKKEKQSLTNPTEYCTPIFKKCVWTDSLSKIKFKQDTKLPLFLSFSNSNNINFV